MKPNASHYFQWEFASQTTFRPFSVLAWYHGRGQTGAKPIVAMTRNNDFNFDMVTVYAGTAAHPEKLVLETYEDAHADTIQTASEIYIAHDKWTHLAVTWTKDDRKYIL